MNSKCEWCGKKRKQFHVCDEWLSSDEFKRTLKENMERAESEIAKKEALRNAPIAGTPEYDIGQLASRVDALSRRVRRLEYELVRKEKGDE